MKVSFQDDKHHLERVLRDDRERKIRTQSVGRPLQRAYTDHIVSISIEMALCGCGDDWKKVKAQKQE